LINTLDKAEYIYKRRENQRAQEAAFDDETDPVYSPWQASSKELPEQESKLLYKNRAVSMDSAENTQGTDDEEVQGLSPRHDPKETPSSPEGEGSEEYYDDDYIDHEVAQLLDESIF
jgi:hypothetical protein